MGRARVHAVKIAPRVRSVREAYTKAVLGEWPEELIPLFAWLDDEGIIEIDGCEGLHTYEGDKVEELKETIEELRGEKDENEEAHYKNEKESADEIRELEHEVARLEAHAAGLAVTVEALQKALGEKP
jgi:hypothetical protein